MISVRAEILNENGKPVTIAVTRDQRGVTISAQGPDIQVEQPFTELEARTIKELLILLEPAYKNNHEWSTK